MIARTAQRMEKRVQQLTRSFGSYVDVFNAARLFTGPSLYFHWKTRNLLRRHSSAADALEDDQFLESIYATLTAWGMHRMGPGNTKLVEFPEFKASLQAQAASIHRLESLCIWNIARESVAEIAARLWDIMNELCIGVGSTKIVVGSKALHHILPALMPPIDREYTIRFFFDSTVMNQGDERAFREIYPQLHRISVACRREIEPHLGVGMNTSPTKVIDNAIVGYGLRHLKAPKRRGS
jgi:hypothetical protein